MYTVHLLGQISFLMIFVTSTVSGRVEEANSLFTYSGGDTYTTMNNDAGYTPLFFNSDLTVMFPNSTIRNLAIALCYSSGSTDPNPSLRRECYYDYAVLENPVLAEHTLNGLGAIYDTQSTYGKYYKNLS